MITEFFIHSPMLSSPLGSQVMWAHSTCVKTDKIPLMCWANPVFPLRGEKTKNKKNNTSFDTLGQCQESPVFHCQILVPRGEDLCVEWVPSLLRDDGLILHFWCIQWNEMYFVRTLVIFLRTIKNRHVMDGFRAFASYTIVLSNMIWLANICKYFFFFNVSSDCCCDDEPKPSDFWFGGFCVFVLAQTDSSC